MLRLAAFLQTYSSAAFYITHFSVFIDVQILSVFLKFLPFPTCSLIFFKREGCNIFSGALVPSLFLISSIGMWHGSHVAVVTDT